MRNDDTAEPVLIRTMRRLLLVIVTVGMLGTVADLLLLEHYEDAWQLIPFALIVLAVPPVAWLFVDGGRLAVILVRTIMAAFIIAGCAGMLFHYNGNREFQREVDPTLAGWPLVMKVMRAKAPPALAPASMIQLGLLGLLSTYRHPSFQSRAVGSATRESRP